MVKLFTQIRGSMNYLGSSKDLVDEWLRNRSHHFPKKSRGVQAMALTVVLKPNEQFVLNGTLVRNGDRSTKLHIETHCRILRESESIKAEGVNTPCKQIWMTLQVIHLSEDPSEAYTLLLKQITELSKVMPSSAPFIAAIVKEIDAKHTHNALKLVKQLVQHEQEVTEQVSACSSIKHG